MIKRINLRDILAWMTLVIAIILFGVTIAFAQTKTMNIENENGKVHIKISTSDNGKISESDTTFNISDDMDVDKIADDFSNAHGGNIESEGNSSGASKDKSGSVKKRKEIIIDDVDDSLMHSHKNYKWHNMNHGNWNGNGKNYSYSYSYTDGDDIDSLNDANHIIIHGGKNENPPVLEKVITSKNGKKIFIYKRIEIDNGAGKEKNGSKEGQKSIKKDIKNLIFYPNPSNGIFNLSFSCDENCDVTIRVLDGNGNDVYSEKLSGFTGDYSKEIDLTGLSKGDYILKIETGTSSRSGKIVIN